MANNTGLQQGLPLHMIPNLLKARLYIAYVNGYVACPFGIIGSVLTILVLRRVASISSTGFSVYLTAIAWSDLLRQVSVVLYMLVGDLTVKSAIYCQVMNVLIFAFSLHADSLVAAVSVDRAIAIIWPHKVKVMSTPAKAKVISVILSIVFLLFTLRNMWLWTADTAGNCVPFRQGPLYVLLWQIFNILGLCVFSINLLIITISGVVIVYSLKQQQKVIAQLQATKDDTNVKKDKQINKMLLSISILFFITNFPIVFTLLSENFFHWSMTSGFHRVLFALVYEISYLFMAWNHSLNFVMYAFSAQFFRQQLKLLFCG